ncbi:MAG: protein kinase domain-containing protein [Terriglobales bacterium]
MPSQLVGQILGHYRIIEQIGAGGMGVVYRAHDEQLERDVAVKVLPNGALADKAARKRFRKEALALAKLNHHNIETVYEFSRQDGVDFLTMELIPGVSLDAKLTSGALPEQEVLRLGAQMAAGLEAAHRQGIVHRDLKPGNLRLNSDHQLKILDFGLAQLVQPEGGTPLAATLTESQQVTGTLPYMAPEQLRGSVADARTDIWAAGAVLYEMATAHRPFEEKVPTALAGDIIHKAPPPPRRLRSELSPNLEAVILKCLEKEPTQRYQTARELQADLERLSRGAAPLAARGRLWPLLAASAIVVVMFAVGAFFSLHRSPKLTDKDTIVLADFTNTTGDPVFDGTLRQGMAVQLGQSPFLSLISEGRIQQTLRLMGRPADARLTPEIAREVCERTASTAVLDGSITSLGSRYILGLHARVCRTGDVLADEQVQAAGKEDVLNALGKIASEFRTRVGESLITVEKHNIPLETATTSSLEALKVYSTAMQISFSAGFSEALPHLRRAVEIDPQFAMAYASMGLMYSNIGESVLAADSTRKAYQLRDRASDRERFFITTLYQRNVTGNLEKGQQTLRLWGETYPRDRDAHGLLAGFATQGTGQYEKSIEEANIALGIDPDFSPGYVNIAFANFFLDRMAEAEKTIRTAGERKRETPDLLLLQYYVAFVNGDAAGMDRAVALAKGKPGVEDWMLHAQALVEARSGRVQAATILSGRAVGMARQEGQKESAASYEAAQAVWQAFFGNAPAARRSAIAALELSNGRDVEYGAAFALAGAGDLPRAQLLAADLQKRFPEDTSVQFNYLPALGALFALNRHEPRKAIEALQVNVPYELAVPAIDFNEFFGGLYPVYVRGEADLATHQALEATAQFQKILDHRGLVAGDPIGTLAHIQIGRAYAMAGDTAKAKASYQDFFALWKDADPDIPILKEAKAEYAKLQ